LTRRQKHTAPRPARLALTAVAGHLTMTRRSVTAWYVLPTTHWAMLTEAGQAGAVAEQAAAWAGLARRRVHLRITTRPQPVAAWARALHAATPAPLPRVHSGPSWADHLTGMQRRVVQATVAEPVVYLGVEVAAGRGAGSLLPSRPAGRELSRLDRAVRDVTRVVAAPGMAGQLAGPADVEWLLRRSIGLGLPAPSPADLSPVVWADWSADDLAELCERVVVTGSPLGRTVQVSDRVAGHSRHVVVLTLGRVEQITVPDTARLPWLADTVGGLVVERSSRLDVVPGPDTATRARRTLLRIRDQQGQYATRGMDEPPDLAGKAAHAQDVMLEATDGGDAVATRVSGQHRFAVSGATAEEAVEAAHEVVRAYAARGMTLVWPKGQAALAAEFVPGERQAFGPSAYRRELPARAVAGGMPTAGSKLGDGRGPYLGVTRSRQPVHFDPWTGPEVLGSSGLVPLVGRQGAGKSALLGALAYWAALRGATVTVLDPSGPLARLCALPEVASWARHVDLLRSPAGTLSPYAVVAAAGGGAEAAYEAGEERMALARDVLRMLLPPGTAQHPDTEPALIRATRAVGGDGDGSLWEVLDHLPSDGPHGALLRELLEDAARSPHGRLFFGLRGQATSTVDGDPRLMVITMPGLQLPDRTASPQTWTATQRISVPLLHLAAYYATSRVYGRPMRERKLLALDEVAQMASWPSGQALFTRLARDTRKWNIAAPVSSQDPGDILGLNVANHVSAAFVGRIEDDTLAAEALRLLRLPQGHGFERVIGRLSAQRPGSGDGRTRPREFLHRDVHGRVDVVTVDLGHTPGLLAALNTNAGTVEAAGAA
jgi:hypothetical protein